MDNLMLASLRDRLTQRRDMVAASLRCVEDRMRAVDENTDWEDEITRRSRENFLDYLDHWFGREIVQVDVALDRLFREKYGVCIGCNGAIESERLEQLPETEFCSACHKLWQQMARR